MRYAQRGCLTAEGRRRRELVRLAVVEKFEQRAPAADIAAERNDNILSIVFPQAARSSVNTGASSHMWKGQA